MKSNIIITLLLFLSLNLVHGQIRPKVAKMANEIAQKETLEGAYIGYSGSESETYKKFVRLSKIATLQELLQLMNNKSNVLKGYIIGDLIQKKYDSLTYIFNKILESKSSVNTLSGCIGGEQSLANLMFEGIIYQNSSENSKWTKEEVEEKISEFSEIALYSEFTDSYLLTHILSYYNPKDKNISRLREICNRDSSDLSLLTLAKLKRNEDIEFIKSFKKKSFLAISEFPHDNFWEFLKEYRTECRNKFYLKAISKYCNKESLLLIKDIVDTLEQLKLESYERNPIKPVFKYISESKCAIFDTLLIKLWENNKMMSNDAFIYLSKKYESQMPNMIKKGLMLKGSFQFVDTEFDENINNNLWKEMFDIIRKSSEKDWNEAISFNIKELHSHELVNFVEYIPKKDRIKYVEEFWINMQTSDYAYDLNIAMLNLLETGVQTYNDKIAHLLKEKRKTWDTGNWSKHFRDNIKKYKLPVQL
jgi:hypothetical protein